MLEFVVDESWEAALKVTSGYETVAWARLLMTGQCGLFHTVYNQHLMLPS
jgi:hypothetical protein